ncbi:MAG: hypothetical protein M3R52_11655 [Acidobacteriota bacterium]|nr:hypothetical protein [Acidobacteriota bacterium]
MICLLSSRAKHLVSSRVKLKYVPQVFSSTINARFAAQTRQVSEIILWGGIAVGGEGSYNRSVRTNIPDS